MKEIVPINQTGTELLATTLKVNILDDNLETFCSFSWWLFTQSGELVNTGVIRCEGNEYSAWSGDNNYPYTFVATYLGLEII